MVDPSPAVVIPQSLRTKELGKYRRSANTRHKNTNLASFYIHDTGNQSHKKRFFSHPFFFLDHSLLTGDPGGLDITTTPCP